MLILTAPAPICGAILEAALADAGLVSAVVVTGDQMALPGLTEADRSAAEAVASVHPQAAQDALDAAAVGRLNESDIRAKAGAALQGNRDFLALASPTNAQTLAQVKALTRQNSGLIRLVLNRFEGTD